MHIHVILTMTPYLRVGIFVFLLVGLGLGFLVDQDAFRSTGSVCNFVLSGNHIMAMMIRVKARFEGRRNILH